MPIRDGTETPLARPISADERPAKMNGQEKERDGGGGQKERGHISEAKLNLPRSVPRDSNQFEGSRTSESL